MSLLESRTVRAAITVGQPFATTRLIDVATGQMIETVRGNYTRFEFGFFDAAGAALDLSEIESLNLKLQPSQTEDGVLADQTITVLDNTLTAGTWADGTKQHAVFEFGNAAMNIDPEGTVRQLWLVLTGLTTTGREITPIGSSMLLHEDNNGSLATPPENPGSYLTVDQGDARFAPLAALISASHTPVANGSGNFVVSETWLGKHAAGIGVGVLVLPAVTGIVGLVFALSVTSQVSCEGVTLKDLTGNVVETIDSTKGVCHLTAFPDEWRITFGIASVPTLSRTVMAEAANDSDYLAIEKFSSGSWLPRRVSMAYIWSWITAKLSTLSGTVNAGGNWTYTSATRPTSSGTGTPAAASLITRADADDRYRATAHSVLIVLGADEAGDTNTVTLKSSPTLTIPLEVGTWAIEVLIVINAGASFAAAGSRQKLHFTGSGTFTGSYYSLDNGSAAGTGWPATRQSGAVNFEHLASGASTSTLRLGMLVVTVPGNLVVQYAQRTAVAAANPTLSIPSYLKALKQ